MGPQISHSVVVMVMVVVVVVVVGEVGRECKRRIETGKRGSNSRLMVGYVPFPSLTNNTRPKQFVSS